MKKRKKEAHINISIAKMSREVHRACQKFSDFPLHAKSLREIFSPRIRQKRKMYLYLERIGKV